MRAVYSLGLLVCFACGQEGPLMLSPAGQSIPGAESVLLFEAMPEHAIHGDWYLCTAPEFLPCLAVENGPRKPVHMVPKPAEDGSYREGGANWFELRNPSGLPFVLDLCPEPIEPLAAFFRLRLAESLSHSLPHIFALLEPRDVERAVGGALGKNAHGGHLWLSRRAIVGLGGRCLLPTTVKQWVSDQPLVWFPSTAEPGVFSAKTGGELPSPTEVLSSPWVVCRADPGSALCLDEEGSGGFVVLAGPRGSQQRELAGEGAYFEQVDPGVFDLAILGNGVHGSMDVQVIEGRQMSAGQVTWLGDFPAPQPVDSALTVRVDLDVRGESPEEPFQVKVSSAGLFQGGRSQVEILLPLPPDGFLVVTGLPVGLWLVSVEAPKDWMLQGDPGQSVQIAGDASCSLKLTAARAAIIGLDLGDHWRSRGPHLLTLWDEHGRRDMTVDLRPRGEVLWNSDHQVPLGSYLCWFRPRDLQPMGQDVAYGTVEIGDKGVLRLEPEPGLVLVEAPVEGTAIPPRGQTLLLADSSGQALDPPLLIVPGRRQDGSAATGLLSASMILVHQASGKRVFDRGEPGTGYSVE